MFAVLDPDSATRVRVVGSMAAHPGPRSLRLSDRGELGDWKGGLSGGRRVRCRELGSGVTPVSEPPGSGTG